MTPGRRRQQPRNANGKGYLVAAMSISRRANGNYYLVSPDGKFEAEGQLAILIVDTKDCDDALNGVTITDKVRVFDRAEIDRYNRAVKAARTHQLADEEGDDSSHADDICMGTPLTPSQERYAMRRAAVNVGGDYRRKQGGIACRIGAPLSTVTSFSQTVRSSSIPLPLLPLLQLLSKTTVFIIYVCMHS